MLFEHRKYLVIGEEEREMLIRELTVAKRETCTPFSEVLACEECIGIDVLRAGNSLYEMPRCVFRHSVVFDERDKLLFDLLREQA